MGRWVGYAGVFNFRDVGMLTGRPGVLGRSDALCSLLEQDRPGEVTELPTNFRFTPLEAGLQEQAIGGLRATMAP